MRYTPPNVLHRNRFPSAGLPVTTRLIRGSSQSFPPCHTPAVNSATKKCRILENHGEGNLERQLLAESETVETVEGSIYFPEESVKREFLRPSSTTSSCPWKGQARYYSLLVDGQENPDAAWYYPDPKPAARNVKHHIAFWRGVEIS